MPELDRYHYELPRELIAQHPLANRSDARLLVVDRERGAIRHEYVRSLPELLRAGDCLVLNDSRVIPAQLSGYRTRTGGRWTGLFLEVDGHGIWKVLGRTRGKIHAGETVTLMDRTARECLRLTMINELDHGIWAALPDSTEPFDELLQRAGRVPLPPYIRDGQMVESDRMNYQTVYAREPGSVAAPTAGLHFTPTLFEQLQAAGIQLAHVTLHVGLGTFRPVSAPRLADHPMHAERGWIAPATADRLNDARRGGGRVVAVGTTAVRVLETAAREDGSLSGWCGETKLFIKPPYRFRATDALMTNFHLPRSTLLILVRTFGGDALITRAYEEAIAEQYRFYSYGDAMLIL